MLNKEIRCASKAEFDLSCQLAEIPFEGARKGLKVIHLLHNNFNQLVPTDEVIDEILGDRQYELETDPKSYLNVIIRKARTELDESGLGIFRFTKRGMVLTEAYEPGDSFIIPRPEHSHLLGNNLEDLYLSLATVSVREKGLDIENGFRPMEERLLSILSQNYKEFVYYPDLIKHLYPEEFYDEERLTNLREVVSGLGGRVSESGYEISSLDKYGHRPGGYRLVK